MLNNSPKNIIITDSGFGGLSVLGQIYETIQNYKLYFPLNLLFVEALPKNCNGYPWKGYSLMPDIKTKIKVFNNFLNGIGKNFNPDLIAIVCNTLSALVTDTKYYQSHCDNILSIIDIGLEKFRFMPIEKDSYIIILGTETTISSDMHRQWFTKNNIFHKNQIIPLSFPSDANYPLLIETQPNSKKTFDITKKNLLKAVKKIHSKNSTIYVYLGCTHFGFIKDQYKTVLQNHGFHTIKIINPNSNMSDVVIKYIKKMNTRFLSEKGLLKKSYLVNLKIYSQFVLTNQQIVSGSNLMKSISPATAEALTKYTLKNNIIEPWKD